MLDTIKEVIENCEEEGLELQAWSLVLHTADGELFMLGAPDEAHVGDILRRINSQMEDDSRDTTHDEPIVIH